MKLPTFRRPRPGRKSIIAAATVSVVAATLGVWAVTGPVAHADEAPGPDNVISADLDYLYRATGRVRRPPVGEPLRWEGLNLGVEDLQVQLGNYCEGIACSYGALEMWASMLFGGAVHLGNLDRKFQGKGISITDFEVGLPEDPLHAHLQAENGSATVESTNPRSVETHPTAFADYTATSNADGSTTGNYYARASVAGETSVAGTWLINSYGGVAGQLQIDSWVLSGPSNVGLLISGAVNIAGAESHSFQMGKTSANVGATARTSGGNEVSVSVSLDSEGRLTKGSLSAEVNIGIPVEVRANFDANGGHFTGEIPGVGVEVNTDQGTVLIKVSPDDLYNWWIDPSDD